ncbi:hypothetical protein AMJ71_09465 [candidate division TA06 bacterium SM1_40]|uniref:EBNA-1 nuclear protein n=1 Tax=candidate division TA06 bacterium SM1_40 TaxID=1703773 RepID=A0A0S8JD42_UNCT6|nr:MAG: hypothetical protein AMJ71_09465 [candidate division TA06 bacterium SM1_40]
MDVINGNAVVYCEGAFNTPNGKTAHGLVRFTRRYRVLAVIDSRYAGKDAGEVLDGTRTGITVYATTDDAVQALRGAGTPPAYFVVGIAPDGGRLGPDARSDVKGALELGLNVDCGLHDFLSEDPEMTALAASNHVSIRDVRKPPPHGELHFFNGKIEEVTAFKVAVLGTDSAVGKRTTAWLIVRTLEERGKGAELIGTGQTAWFQGACYSIMLDALINDFVSGEIEHAVWSAWHDQRPDVIVIEGQGSLMNPAYPGGFEILAAGRPDVIVLQHAPARRDYDGFPGYLIQPLDHQIKALEIISGKTVVAITVNHEHMEPREIPAACEAITKEVDLPAFDVLVDGAGQLVDILESAMREYQVTSGKTRIDL